MKFSVLCDSYTDSAFRGSEAEKAISEFMRNIPGRVKQFEFDASRSNKQGIRDGDRVYKLGLDMQSGTVFLEYYENLNQGQPTMALYIDRPRKTVTVNGWQVDKQMHLKYEIGGGEVRKTVKIDK